MNKTLHNELLKLRANFCNTIGAAFATIGFVTPSVTLVYGLNSVPVDPALVFTGSLVSLLISFALHLEGRKSLRGLIE